MRNERNDFATIANATPACTVAYTGGALDDESVLLLNTYDFMAHIGKRVINPGGLAGRDHALAALAPRPGSHLLEIGCGTGHAACYIARRYRCRVTAIDISPAMVAQARREVAAQNLAHLVDCRVADVTALPFVADSFDGILSQAVLMFVDKAKAMAEVSRVLRPGGRFAGLEFAWRRQPPADIRLSTYRICGCKTLEFFPRDEWGRQFGGGAWGEVNTSEYRFGMLSIPGFIRDEGLGNTVRIVGRLVNRKANLVRMKQIWDHFATHTDYFSYVVLSANKMPA